VRTDDPTKIPRNIGIVAPPNPHPWSGIPREGVAGAPGPGFGGSGNSGSNNGGASVGSLRDDLIPPAPVRKVETRPKIIEIRVLNGRAVSLPKPPYPMIAKQAGIQGTVEVQVLIDEKGNVVSARAVSGNPMLTFAAVRAAWQARFTPTLLRDEPVKVSGVITYNFVLR